MTEHTRIRILTTCTDEAVVRRAAEAYHRAATVEHVSEHTIRRLEPADCLVVDTADHARTARATGFDGAIVIFGMPRDEEEADFLLQGTHFAPATAGADGIAAALCNAMSHDGVPAVVDPSVARSRRLLAAGELAVRLRHAFNNPLAALMAEVQMLQMEARDAGTRAATDRMLELVRRLTELSLVLESVNDRPGGL